MCQLIDFIEEKTVSALPAGLNIYERFQELTEFFKSNGSLAELVEAALTILTIWGRKLNVCRISSSLISLNERRPLAAIFLERGIPDHRRVVL